MYTKILNSKTMNEYDPAGTVIPCRVIFFLGEGAEDLTVTKERKSPVQGGLHRGSYINGVLIYSATNSFISE